MAECIDKLNVTFSLLVGIAFDQIKMAFGERRIYVLFEPRLNCDPETDHINPKNVYPLFQQAIDRSKKQLDDLNRLNLKYQFEQAVAEATYIEMERRIYAEDQLLLLQ